MSFIHDCSALNLSYREYRRLSVAASSRKSEDGGFSNGGEY